MCDCTKTGKSLEDAFPVPPLRYETVADQMRNEVEKIGREVYLRRISSAARKALSMLPDLEDVDKLDKTSRRFVERISALVAEGLEATRMDDARFAAFASDLAWGTMASTIAVAAMARDNSGGGGGGPTCVTKCANEYDQCVTENNCDTGGWICLCCTPCSLQYMGCVAKCVTVGGGFGVVIA